MGMGKCASINVFRIICPPPGWKRSFKIWRGELTPPSLTPPTALITPWQHTVKLDTANFTPKMIVRLYGTPIQRSFASITWFIMRWILFWRHMILFFCLQIHENSMKHRYVSIYLSKYYVELKINKSAISEMSVSNFEILC